MGRRVNPRRAAKMTARDERTLAANCARQSTVPPARGQPTMSTPISATIGRSVLDGSQRPSLAMEREESGASATGLIGVQQRTAHCVLCPLDSREWALVSSPIALPEFHSGDR